MKFEGFQSKSNISMMSIAQQAFLSPFFVASPAVLVDSLGSHVDAVKCRDIFTNKNDTKYIDEI